MQAIATSTVRLVAAAGALIAATVATRPARVVAPVITRVRAEPWRHDRPSYAVLIFTLAIHGGARCHDGWDHITDEPRRITDRRVGDRLQRAIDTGTLPTQREGSHPILYGGCEPSSDARYWQCSVRGLSVDIDGPFGDDVFVRIRTSDGSPDLDTLSC